MEKRNVLPKRRDIFYNVKELDSKLKNTKKEGRKNIILLQKLKGVLPLLRQTVKYINMNHSINIEN